MMDNQALSKRHANTAKMIKISLLGAISFALMAVDFPLPIFPSFLKFDISDLPSLVGGFALGPACAVMIQLIKNVLKFVILGSQTGGVGELSNFFIGSSFVLTASVIYKNHKSLKAAVFSCLSGTVVMTFLGAFSNYYVMLPLYSKFMPMDAIINLGTAINPAIKDSLSLVLYGIVPFNIFKGLVISVLTMLIYKKISTFLKK